MYILEILDVNIRDYELEIRGQIYQIFVWNDFKIVKCLDKHFDLETLHQSSILRYHEDCKINF